MKTGDLVRVNYGPGIDNALPAHLKNLPDFHDGKIGIVVGHVMGRWWSILVGDRKVEMDIKTLELVEAV